MANYDNLLTLDRANAKIKAVQSGDTVTMPSSLVISGNLTVSGTTTTIDTELVTSDAFVLMNSETTATSSQKGGLVIVENVSASTTSAVSAFTSTTITTGADISSLLTAGDILLIQSAGDPENNGLVEVNSVSTTTITIKSSPSSNLEGLVLTGLTSATGQSANVYGATVSALRSDGAQGFEIASGNSAGTLSFSTLSTSSASASMQASYNGGNSFQLANGNSFTITKPASGTAGINFTGNANSEITVESANLTIDTVTSGDITLNSVNALSLTGANAVNLTAGANSLLKTTNGSITLQTDDDNVNLIADQASSRLYISNYNANADGIYIEGFTTIGGDSYEGSSRHNPAGVSAGIQIKSTSSSAVAVGRAYGINSSGVVTACDAVSGSSVKEVFGIGQRSLTTTVHRLCTLAGTVAFVELDSAPSAVGVVYLGSSADTGVTAGQGTMTPPNGVGERVTRIGQLMSTTGISWSSTTLYPVLLGIQYIADN
jgi:hypothetical protein